LTGYVSKKNPDRRTKKYRINFTNCTFSAFFGKNSENNQFYPMQNGCGIPIFYLDEKKRGYMKACLTIQEASLIVKLSAHNSFPNACPGSRLKKLLKPCFPCH
jgi:hypothetical protein